MQNKPFITQTRKIDGIEKQIKFNENKIDSIKNTNLYYGSINTAKRIREINVLNRYMVPYQGEQLKATLINFPESLIDTIYPSIVYSLDSAYNPQNNVGFSNPDFSGQLKVGDMDISFNDSANWFIQRNGYFEFVFRLIAKAQYVASVEPTSIIDIPVFADVKLNFLNNRDYSQIQSGK